MAENVRIRLLGTSFTIQTDQNPDYVESLVAYLRDKAAEIERSAGTIDSLKASILVSLLVVDELFQARRDRPGVRDQQPDEGPQDRGEDRIDQIALGLIERIDSVLEDDKR